MKHFEKIEQMAASADNPYLFSVAVSRRVRSLQEGAPALVAGVSDPMEQAVEAAFREFAEGRLKYALETSGEN